VRSKNTGKLARVWREPSKLTPDTKRRERIYQILKMSLSNSETPTFAAVDAPVASWLQFGGHRRRPQMLIVSFL
jgi:hypothetical protein